MTVQPRWIRPALMLVAAAAAVLYSWRLGEGGLHPYYAPAVKSMSVSWRAFFYGGYDPAASITLDKLPGAFMLQALSARVFGFHTWSVLLPQVIAAVATVLVLYLAVRRWQGPVVGLAAAGVYAFTPIVAALARAEISDTVLVLLLVLAADAWQRAIATARLRSLVWCGVWVGLAFQTKMVQAWGVLPAFALLYLFSAPTDWRRRLGHLGVAGLVTAAVSLCWIAMVMLTPPPSRPYIDGSGENSALSMVFGYNLTERFDGPARSWWYMFGDGTAPQVGWLYPIALAGLVFGTLWRGRAPRTDPVRAGFLMWGLWLIVHAVAFSTGRVAHVFYVVAVAPAVAALAAAGAATLWDAYRAEDPAPSWRRWMLPATTAVTTLWATHLALRFPDFLPWVAPAVAIAGALATVSLAVAMRAAGGWAAVAVRLGVAGAAVSAVAILLAPTAWAVSTLDTQHRGSAIGPSAGVGGDLAAARRSAGGPPPGGPGFLSPGAIVRSNEALPAAPMILRGPVPNGAGNGAGLRDRPSPAAQRLLAYLKSRHDGERYLVAVQGTASAGDLLLSGESVLPMGGFNGRVAFPTAEGLAAMVAGGQVRFVLLGPGRSGVDAALHAWVAGHCRAIEAAVYGAAQPVRGEVLFDCGKR